MQHLNQKQKSEDKRMNWNPHLKIATTFLSFIFCLHVNAQFYATEVPPTSDVRNWSLYGSSVEVMDSFLVIGAAFGGDWSPNEEHVFVFKKEECKWEVFQHWNSATFSSKYMGAKLGTNSQWIAFSENRGGCKINLHKYENGAFVKKKEINGGYCSLTHYSNLAMSDDFLMVGGNNQVKVYKFEDDDLILTQTIVGDYAFGEMVALDGGKMIVSRRVANFGAYTGSARVYTYDGSTWNFKQELHPSDTHLNHNFATSVHIQGGYAFVADNNFNYNYPSDVSKLYIYKQDAAGTYQQIDVLAHPTANTNISNFGADVNMDDTYLYIGSNISNTTSLYTYENDDFQFVKEIIGGDDIAIHPNGLLATGYGRHSANGFNRGMVYEHTKKQKGEAFIPSCILPLEVNGISITNQTTCPIETVYNNELTDVYFEFYDSFCEDEEHFTCRFSYDFFIETYAPHTTPPNDNFYSISWEIDTFLFEEVFTEEEFLVDPTSIYPTIALMAPSGKFTFTAKHYFLDSLIFEEKVPISINNDWCSGFNLPSEINVNYGDTIDYALTCYFHPDSKIEWRFSETFLDIYSSTEGTVLLSNTTSLKYIPNQDGYLYLLVINPELDDYCGLYSDAKLNVMLVDLDQDGFTNDIDCDDSNASIFPGAEEVPNNGIDEDCNGEDLLTSTSDVERFSIDIFPNPVLNDLYIEVNRAIDYTIEIFTVTGIKVYTGHKDKTIHMAAFKNGNYIVRIKNLDSGESKIERVIVAR
ncbi:MAG: MopE-related protein [Saprospiraceae bacterium]|nr:MopE-related protein [Saprospiraceae bacterium]